MKKNNPGLSSAEAGPACRWSSEAIRAQLKRILGHAEFQATDKMHDFLRFVVEETLAGRSQNIKGFTIAVEVYGRDANFDAAHDPVVRIQAGRLRRAIERYYLVSGGQDPIRIEIPKGSYVPVFSEGPGCESFPDRVGALPMAQRSTTSWPTILITPFDDLTGNPDLAYLGVGLATELCVELGHCEDLRVMLYRAGPLDLQELNARPDFIVSGNVRFDGSAIKIVMQLSDGATGEQYWVDSMNSPLEADSLITFQEKAANTIAAHIASVHGVIMRTMTMQLGSRLADLTTYEAILKGYAYHHTITPVSYMQALDALQQIRVREPECGLGCTLLALLYMDNVAFEFLEPDRTPLNEAVHMAREGVLILPNNQFSRLVLARGHMLENQLDLALSEVKAALALRPESLLFMDAIGYMLLLLGEWERGEQLVREAIRQNPFYAVYARYGLWLNAIRRQDYERALEETEITIEIGDFWGPLSRAATLGLLGRSAEGRDVVQQLLLLKPNFQERGRLLIGHYVKFPEIVDQLVEGLAIAGLTID
jgi:TolB-like protein